jgi:hypothetical protein
MDLGQESGIGHDHQRLLQLIEILVADEHGGRLAVARHDNSLMLTLHAIDEL